MNWIILIVLFNTDSGAGSMDFYSIEFPTQEKCFEQQHVLKRKLRTVNTVECFFNHELKKIDKPSSRSGDFENEQDNSSDYGNYHFVLWEN